LCDGDAASLGELLEREEIDLAITLIEKKVAAGIHSLKLVELPLVLLVEKGSGIKSAEELWGRDRIEEPLICLPKAESIAKIFQAQLNRRDVDWFPDMEINSLDLIETYAANGWGIGLSVAIPGKTLSPKVRVLSLPGFPPVIIGALWRRHLTPLLRVFLDELKLRAQKFA